MIVLPNMNELPKRKHNRLTGYDYSQSGAYFITICARNKTKLFGTIPITVGADTIRPPGTIRTQLSATGIIVENAILKIPQMYTGVSIDCYVIMPNHVHMIVVISNNDDGRILSDGCGRIISAPTSSSISKIIGYFKQYASRIAGFSLWQKSFHDRIIRNDDEYNHIYEYIKNNPLLWDRDCLHPAKMMICSTTGKRAAGYSFNLLEFPTG